MDKFRYVKPGQIMAKDEEMIRFLDIDGNLLSSTVFGPIDETNDIRLSKQEIKKAYEFMVLSRQQDTYMTQLQRQGRMLTFAPNFGEEALQVASGMALTKDDWFVPAFRSNATMLYLGVPMILQMQYWNGSEKGNVIPENVNVLPINIPIGTQFSHAAGIAYAAKLTGKKIVSMSFIGNGGTAEGEFYEALNIASIWKWPVVFCVNNNQWAISTPNKYENGASTIAAKAMAAGIPGIRVDGNDLLASYEVIKEAVDYARSGNGPVLVEFVTWRQGVHTSSDNPRIYRTVEEEKEHEKWEPMHRIEKYMFDRGILDSAEKQKIWDEALAIVKETYEKSLVGLESTIDEIFDHTYKVLPPELEEQKQEALEFFKGVK
ncbi:pyruvate dehydrogenase (acetyl-transferring) E1 component subunit alpha [Mesomycoplasma hyopneumoniae]|uniref:Pyruvate dehydrogenase E1 component subunit alpha n=4 Tax=Mesomycoplasma hyopneumoniae TaxID=2099 RepID=Q8KQQ9_MESHO|nr:pyruvate dehydrogenase (acetyl-transferring) E1 component subunit alpha [Mesomycoplasma hyopneumoniae]AAL34978.1 pyruvate dehydrogenase E1-alpha subunit [Mesomycoplasma hyopneumoniae]AAV27797.1 pyruvate dehydrogenase (lipoamide) e1-alpha chain [Mesomycoplasma hyopneumoniae 232]AAZ44203.1 pyruvate dehydrogenase E1-alpha subunit [Mesomycoplasma hyopneumoniae J]ADQ90401.1 Pyruvate dehydrogenase E1-alpha subunit [Mesomycoplasma hyopneumoniae 168]ASU14266.1 Pyruvate dehydrogenase E1 component su